MARPAGDGSVATTPSTSIDAARLALRSPAIAPTPRRDRLLGTAATLWCRGLQFPTVRQIGAAMGHASPSSPLNGFGRLIEIQAEVIRREWRSIEEGWLGAGPAERSAWLVLHVRRLLALDPACVRLPALVSTAVSAAQPGVVDGASLAPLHALAAFAHLPARAEEVARSRAPGGARRVVDGLDLAVSA